MRADQGRRKRIADVAEKLGVGLFIGVMAQGVFAQRLTRTQYLLGGLVLTIASLLIVISAYLSKEDGWDWCFLPLQSGSFLLWGCGSILEEKASKKDKSHRPPNPLSGKNCLFPPPPPF